MRIGLVGVGRIGTMHARVLNEHEEVTQLVLHDPITERATGLAASLDAMTVGTVDELLAAGLDGLVVASATGSHADLVKQGVAAGVPVFCEKPVALGVDETEDVLAHVRSAGVPVQVGFHRRFDPGYVEARGALRSGQLGELRRMHLVSADPAPPDASFIRTSGGIFRDLFIHDFDAVRWVTGHEVTSVYVSGANRGASFFREAGDVDECTILMVLDDDTLVTGQASRYNGAGYDVRMELAGTDATYAVGLCDHSPLRSAEPATDFPSGPAWVLFSDRFRAAYAAEISAFLDVAAGRSPSPCTVEDALASFYVAEAADIALREQRQVQVNEVISSRKANA